MKKGKKALALMLSMFLVLSTVACSANSNKDASKETKGTESTKQTDGKKLKIGYSYPTANNEFWGNALQYVKEAADTVGFEVMADDCNNDQAEQVSDVESMISSGIDALVLGPQDATVCAGITASCKAKGIPVVIIDRWPGDDLKAGDDYVCFIGPNDEDAGYNMAKSLIDAGCTKLVGIGGYQGTSVAEGRKKGLDKALKENPDVELLQFVYAGENWDDGDKAFRNLQQAHSNIDGVWCYNDSLALASVNVLKENGNIANVNVGGMDLLNPAVESMNAKELWFSTGGHYMQAAFGAIVAYDVASGVEYNGDLKIQLNLLNVSQENVADFEAKFIKGDNAIDWKGLTKTQNPDSKYNFDLSL